MNSKHVEIEAHFIDVDVNEVKKKLLELGAKDLGEDYLREIIFYDKELTWMRENKFIRLRSTKKGTTLSFKHFQYEKDNGSPEMKPEVKEIETVVSSGANAKLILELTGLTAYREQEKRRHSFTYKNVVIDIDQWPKIPAYVEIEGPSKEEIKVVSDELGLQWDKAIFRGAAYIITHFYGVPVTDYHYFTFEKVE